VRKPSVLANNKIVLEKRTMASPASNVVTVETHGDVAVLSINNPPVNALSHALRSGLADGLAAVAKNDAIKAIVLHCQGRTFVAGADITEFGKPAQSPILPDVIAMLEASSKPTVAAIHGTALGGGLELALGCHYRVAGAEAKWGLPEVKLGLLPGAGGTQRLPRAIGPIEALKVIVTGNHMPAKIGLEHGLLAEIISGDLKEGAIAFARKVAAKGGKHPSLRNDTAKLAVDIAKFEEAAGDVLKRSRGLEAPVKCAEAVRMSMDGTISFDDALKRERAMFMGLVSGDQSKAQRHLFFAEREAAKVPGVGPDVKPREVKSAAVLGAGTMGGGIAMCFASAGIPVTLIEQTQEALDRGLGVIRKNYEATAKRTGKPVSDVDKTMALFTGKIGLAAANEADIVIEAVFEEMALKKKVFAELDRVVKPGAVIASNTSYLNIDTMAAETKRPRDILGMHFFSPANVMKLLEIVRAKETAPDVLATAMAVARKIGKVPVVVGMCDGFVGNRMLAQRSRQCEKILLEGALPYEVDAVVLEFGFPMGPFAMGDLAGLDIGWRSRKDRGIRSEVADTICEKGHFGQKTGRGYYIYEAGRRTPVRDPEVEQIIVEASKKLGITRRPISKDEILGRMIYPMINEGARILEEGIAVRSSDIDITWINGYGFPIGKGGPMHWADTIGLAKIRDALTEYAKLTGDDTLKPAPLLVKLAAEGKGFGSLPVKKA
jgi:3-hydroxyacyl-CoA dehydrogenase